MKTETETEKTTNRESKIIRELFNLFKVKNDTENNPKRITYSNLTINEKYLFDEVDLLLLECSNNSREKIIKLLKEKYLKKGEKTKEKGGTETFK